MSTPMHTIKQGDTLPKLAFTLKGADGAVQNLTGATVRFSMSDFDTGVVIIDRAACTVDVDPTTGSGYYTWTVQDTAVAGRYKGEIEVSFPGSNIMTFPNDGNIIIRIVAEIA
jgi:hypothetical protein